MIKKIISGGQTGVDRAALDVAIKLKIPQGGWCPKGRRAELNTIIPPQYQMQETESAEFEERTKLNIRDSDGTLILVPSTSAQLTDGTMLTINEAQATGKPNLIVDLSKPISLAAIIKWIRDNKIAILNVAGPRESKSPGIYERSCKILENIMAQL